VTRLRRNPLFRALRVDKLINQALEATLRNLLFERWSKIPALAMITQTPAEVYQRAESLLTRFPELDAEILPGKSVIGGGATPDQTLDTWLIAPQCADAVEAERLLRAADPPVIGRIEADRLVLDLRTVLPGEEDFLGQALAAVTRAPGTSLPTC
jgi:L-seryl-tRNA(Ser) seleniumtransferase